MQGDPVYDYPDSRPVGDRRACPQRGILRSISVLDRLLLTHPVWLQLSVNSATALHILRREPPGVSKHIPNTTSFEKRQLAYNQTLTTFLETFVTLQTFLVRKSSTSQKKMLCVRLADDSTPSFIKQVVIREEDSGEFVNKLRLSSWIHFKQAMSWPNYSVNLMSTLVIDFWWLNHFLFINSFLFGKLSYQFPRSVQTRCLLLCQSVWISI